MEQPGGSGTLGSESPRAVKYDRAVVFIGVLLEDEVAGAPGSALTPAEFATFVQVALSVAATDGHEDLAADCRPSHADARRIGPAAHGL
jgi:hypothetical protein